VDLSRLTHIVPILVAATAMTAAAAPCPRYGLEPVVLTADAAKVTPDGGMVVGVEPKAGGEDVTGEIAVQPAWRFSIAGKPVKPKVDVIAPGLAVYRPPASSTAIVLENGKGTRVGQATVAAVPDTLPAPRVRTVVVTTTRGVKHPSTRVEVDLDGNPPATALALVLVGADGRAIMWGTPAGTSQVVVYDTHGGCTTFPNGTTLPSGGDRVTAFWVDTAGRRSPATPKLIVTQN
jgi:hypothetical protein